MPEFWLQHCVKGKDESKTDRTSFAIKIAKVRSISCVFYMFLKNVTVDMNQRYLFVNKGHFYEIDETFI